MCVCMCVCACACVHVCARMLECVLCVCVCVCMCVATYVYVCTHVLYRCALGVYTVATCNCIILKTSTTIQFTNTVRIIRTCYLNNILRTTKVINNIIKLVDHKIYIIYKYKIEGKSLLFSAKC